MADPKMEEDYVMNLETVSIKVVVIEDTEENPPMIGPKAQCILHKPASDPKDGLESMEHED